MADDLNKADLVRLKSGGPIMTVSSLHPTREALMVNTIWFNGKKQLFGNFDAALLDKVDPAELKKK